MYVYIRTEIENGAYRVRYRKEGRERGKVRGRIENVHIPLPDVLSHLPPTRARRPKKREQSSIISITNMLPRKLRSLALSLFTQSILHSFLLWLGKLTHSFHCLLMLPLLCGSSTISQQTASWHSAGSYVRCISHKSVVNSTTPHQHRVKSSFHLPASSTAKSTAQGPASSWLCAFLSCI